MTNPAASFTVHRADHRGAESWRAVVTNPDGSKLWFRRPTQAQAQAAAEAAIAAGAIITIERAIDEYCRLRYEGGAWSKHTERRARLDLGDLVAADSQPITSMNRQALLEYLQRTQHLALASRRTRWASVVQWLKFCVAEGWLDRNPADLIDRSRKPWLGRRAKRQIGRGKALLRNSEEVQRYITEARKLVALEERVATLLPLLCNMRSGEVLHLTCGDVDLPLGVLHVRDQEAREYDDDGWAVKSTAGRRAVHIPALLQGDLALLVEGHELDRWLFGCWGREKGNRRRRVPHDCEWLARLVEGVCERAQTRIVKPHGLRGTYMTVLAVVGKVAPMDIARLVGHGDAGYTAERHYLGALSPSPAMPDLGKSANTMTVRVNPDSDSNKSDPSLGQSGECQ